MSGFPRRGDCLRRGRRHRPFDQEGVPPTRSAQCVLRRLPLTTCRKAMNEPHPDRRPSHSSTGLRASGRTGGVMSYKVIFYREIVNSYGKPFDCSVYTTEIGTAASVDEAVAAAIDAFKRDRGLSCWRALAHGYSVIHEAEGSMPAVPSDEPALRFSIRTGRDMDARRGLSTPLSCAESRRSPRPRASSAGPAPGRVRRRP